MKFKRLFTCVVLTIALFAFTTTVFADINMGSDDGTGFGSGSSNNFWGVYSETGLSIQEAEGLRITVYDAESGEKKFNTIDITGNPNISSVSDIWYFADSFSGGYELIPKTTWLATSYIGATYNSIEPSAITRYSNIILSRMRNIGYPVQYVPELANLDIISENNTSNLEVIKNALGSENFLRNICDLIGNGLKYDDFAAGKYKIAFEPVAYFRYGGYNWALTATECGIYNKFLKNTKSAEWNTTNNMRAQMGPLTHSNLPRSAFLEYKDLGISVYSPTESDYYNGNSNYNSDTCIIRCMGIGTLGAAETEEELPEVEAISQYHTDTTVYTSVTFYNDTEKPYFGFTFDSEEDYPISEVWNTSGNTFYASSFDVYYADGDEHITNTGESTAVRVSEYYLAGTYDTSVAGMTREQYNDYISNLSQRYNEANQQMKDAYNKAVADWREAGGEGECPISKPNYLTVPDYVRGGTVSFKITDSSGKVIKQEGVPVCCPAGAQTTVYVKWKTPSKEQDITIQVTTDSGKLIYDGSETETINMTAEIVKVKEITPPDPTVRDTRPSWFKNYSLASVGTKIDGYVSDNITELTWTEWECEWTQDIDPYEVITYYGFNEKYTYIGSSGSVIENSVFHRGAVEVTGFTRKTYTVKLNAQMQISPANECKTATYSNATGKYTMKSGYGIQIEVASHLSGNGTDQCTGTQTGSVLFPEFNYNRQNTALYNRLLEKVGNKLVFKENEYSTYNSRVHFTPIWYPDNTKYIVYAEVFDVWCPAGQLTAQLTDYVTIKGNVYDDWHVAPVKP